MNELSQIVTAMSSIVIAGAAVWIAIEMRRSRFLIEELVFRDNWSSGPAPDDDIDGPGHAVFIGKDGQWVLASDMSGPGHIAVPPTMEPSYEGQVIRRRSVPESAS